MRNYVLVPILSLFLLSACNDGRTPSSSTFTAAINQYLASHDRVCISIGSQFPIDIPVSQQSGKHETIAKLTALEHAGLLNATDTTAVVQSLANSLSLSPHKPAPVKRYTVSSEGQKYLQDVMTDFGKTSGFCYGQKQVDSIIKWTEPQTAGPYSQAEVTYTYKLMNLAGWAERPEVQRAFPDIGATASEASKTNEVAGVQLTNKGWEVPGY